MKHYKTAVKLSIYSSSCLFLNALLFSFSASAGPLDEFAKNNGGTEVQVAIAQAIQSICPKLVASFGGLENALAAPDSSDKDITLRCNELISTSVGLDAPNTAPSRSLNYTEADQLLSALQQVTGEELNSQSTMTVRTANSQASNIASRLGAVRMGTSGAGNRGAASAYNFNMNGIPVAGSSDDYETPALGGAASADSSDVGLPPLGWFVNGSYNNGDRDETDLEDGIDFDAYGITAGVDYRFDRAVLGASIGYDDFDADFNNSSVVSGGDMSAEGFTASVFGMLEFGDFYVDGVAMYGQLDYDMNRVLQYASDNNDPNCQCPNQDRIIKSSTDGNHYTLAVNSGWQGYVDAWVFQPTVGVSYRSYDIDGYSEKDSSPDGGMELRYGDQNVDSLRSIVGLRVSRAFNQSYGVLHPTVSLDWYHEFEDNGDKVDAKYAQEDQLAGSNPGLGFSTGLSGCLSCFTIVGEDPDADYGVVGAGVALVLPNFLQFLVAYEGLVGYEDLTSNAITFSVRGQF
jgi:uncharacterized protein YhjY with autotransporter beta-barrel domain